MLIFNSFCCITHSNLKIAFKHTPTKTHSQHVFPSLMSALLDSLLLTAVWSSFVACIIWWLSVLPSVQPKPNSSWVNEKVDGWPEGSRSAVLHQEGGAGHHFWEERAQNQPVPGAGGAQLLSEVRLLYYYTTLALTVGYVIYFLAVDTLSCHNFKELFLTTCKWLCVSAGRSWMRRGAQVSY